jgi:hypothetical protein
MASDFKSCSLCHKSWPSREEFLSDGDVTLVGYQPDFEDLDLGTLVFNHVTPECGTTMEIEIESFADLYGGPIYETPLNGTDECHGHCLRIENLERCEQRCKNAWAREVARIVFDRTQRLD